MNAFDSTRGCETHAPVVHRATARQDEPRLPRCAREEGGRAQLRYTLAPTR
ncbi:MAG: hypothetical protein MZV49_17275 [Rhodopseudomonas palustris]|nr:hypothetical protein [Rhodopseudomonas palustris]